IDSSHADLREARGAFAELANRVKSRVLDDGVLQVGHFAVVLKKKPTACTTHGGWPLHPGDPIDGIQRMRPKTGHLTPPIIPKSADVVNGAIRIIGPLRCRTEPHVVVQFRGGRTVGRISEPGRDIAKIIALHRDQFSETATANQVPGALVMRSGTLLSAHLD